MSPGATFTTSIDDDAIQPRWLVEIQGSTTLRYALHADDITFDGETFTAIEGTVGTVTTSIEGKTPGLQVKLGNADRVIRDWLRATDQRGSVVILRVVLADHLDETDVPERELKLDAYKWDHREAVLSLSATTPRQRAPNRTTGGFHCPWTYMGTECGYQGSLKTCDYTYAGKNGCKAHFGTGVKRFGGFIGKASAELGVY